MRVWNGAAASAALLLLANCSTHPIPDDVTRITTFDIAEQIRCEAARAVKHYGKYYTTAAIAYEFDFQISEENNSTGGVSWNMPFVNGGGFSGTANAGLNRTRSNTRNFKIVDRFDELTKVNCSKEAQEKNWVYPIAGDIGVYEVVSTFIRLQTVEGSIRPAVGSVPAGSVFTFSDKLTFTTILNGGVKPKLMLNPVTDRFRVVEANLDLNARRSDIHAVTLALAGDVTGTKAPGKGLAEGMRKLSPGIDPSSSLVATTVIQSAVEPANRALLELDRQRILTLQERSQILLISP